MEQISAKDLIEKYKRGTLTDEEKAILETWYIRHAGTKAMVGEETDLEQNLDEIWNSIALHTRPADKGIARRIRTWRYMAAASIIIGLSIAGYYTFHPQNQADVSPGSKTAILKFGNGKSIVLSDTLNGTIAREGKTVINKTADGQITYNGQSPMSKNDNVTVYDTIINPAGSKTYSLHLADGSNLILDAATTVRFPEIFDKTERKFDLISGQVFFAVHYKAGQPFNTYVKGQLVKDLGTHFNISAYSDESFTKVTLLEGSVQVLKASKTATLIPGQQAVTGITDQIEVLKDVDTEQITAWKNGYFRFNGEHIQEIMRQLSRWYNIDVRYSGNITTEGFYCKISRFKNISSVLKMLEETKGVHFKIEGRRVTVMQ